MMVMITLLITTEQVVQPAPSADIHRLDAVDAAVLQKPIKSIIVPESEPSELPPDFPYRTRVDYRADDQYTPTASTVLRAPVDHVTAQPHSRDTRLPATANSQQSSSAAQTINVVSPSSRDAATRIQIDDRLDR